MTDALTGSELAAIRDRRHRDRADARGERLANRRAEVLDPTFLRDALLSKVGIQHCLAAVHAFARGNTGQLGKGELRRALDQLLSTNQRKATNGKSH